MTGQFGKLDAYFSNGFSSAIQKFRFILIPSMEMKSWQVFEYATTAPLSYHV